MKNHPLGLASRYNDAEAEEKGLPALVESVGLEMGTLMYAVEQRATRCVLAVTRPEMLPLPPGFGVISLTPHERTVHRLMQLALIDGIMVGWRARQIAERDGA